MILAGKLYFSNIVPLLPDERPWRADFGCLALVWRSAELRGHLNLDFNERVSLPQLLDRLTIVCWSGEAAIRATILASGVKAELGLLHLPHIPNAANWRSLVAWASTLRLLMDSHPGSDPTISIADLMNASNWLERLHSLFTSRSMKIEYSHSEDDDPTHAIIYRLRCDIGAWSFFAILRREVAVDDVKDGLRTLYLKPSELLEAYVAEGSWNANIESVLPSYKHQVRAMGDPTYFWDLGDLEDWIGRMTSERRPDPDIALP